MQGHAITAYDALSPYTLDYRGTQTVLKRSGRKWCFDAGRGRRCAATFRQAVVAAKYDIDMKATYGTENPDGGGFLLALVAAAVGGLGTYLYMRYRAGTAPITDPAQIAQAKSNLSQATSAGTKLNVATPYTIDQPPVSVTPAFTQSLAQFQAAFNQFATPAAVSSLQTELGGGVTLPPLPLRTDGVLDRPTFDWLVYSQG